MVYEHILLASGGSPHSRLAEERAVKIARALDARLTLLSVIRQREMPRSQVMGERNPEREQIEQEAVLVAARDRCEAHGMRPQTMLATGDAGTKIVDTAKELGCDLIVVGSRQLSRLDTITGNSVADYVARRAEADVLVVH